MGTSEEQAQLTSAEAQILRTLLEEEKLTLSQLAKELGMDTGAITSNCERLAKRGLIKIHKSEEFYLALTETGKEYVDIGAPEDRLIRFLQDHDEIPLDELAGKVGLTKQEFSGAFGLLMKSKSLAVRKTDSRKVVSLNKKPEIPTTEILKKIASNEKLSESEKSLLDVLLKRGLLKKETKTTLTYQLIPGTKEEIIRLLKIWESSEREITNLTPELLTTGKWRTIRLKKYDMSIPPPYPARWGMRHGYYAFLDYVRQKFMALGFKEMEGSIIVPEFWNMDALYMPQFHPARAIHDAYYVDLPPDDTLEKEFIEAVAKVHETGKGANSRGWQYHFDRNVTRRMVLRSQGTALSAWTLAHKPDIPGRYFGIAKCFRYDKIDATHLPDFYQVEGIVLDENNNFGTLLSLLKLFAREFAGTEKIKLVPAYFPFTEPSVELHAEIPGVGWVELGGAGIFRPEVTKPFGIDVPVLAWGLGLDRIGMLAFGIKDIRQLLSRDLEELRDLNRRVTSAKIRGKLR